jgi:hypothetical protein
MVNDPIVAEVRRIRQEHAAKFNYDLEAIYRDLKTRQTRNKRKIVSRPPKLHLESTGS